MRPLLLFALVFIALQSVFAQQVRVRTFTTPFMGSVYLTEGSDKYNAVVYSLEAPNPDASTDRQILREVKKEIEKQFPRKISTAQHKTTAAPSPMVSMGFVADSLSGIPPDNDMAISKQEKAISVINSSFAVLNAQTGKMLWRRSLGFMGLKLGLAAHHYDPKVIYDPEKDRFIYVNLNGTDDENNIVIGFSKSNDPQGGWNLYKFHGDFNNDSTWFDFPCIAMTKDEFFLTGNMLGFNTSWQTGFKQTVIYQIKKQDGYDSASSLSYQIWDNIVHNGRPIRNLYPVKGGSGILGPQQYFVSNRNFDVQNDTIFLVKVPDVISSGNKSLDIKVLKSPLSYGVPPNGRQPDTSAVLATNDGRILGAFADGDIIQFVSASVDPANGSSAVYHARILNYQTNPVIDHAQMFSIDTLDFGYPNVTFAGNPWGLPQSLISFNYTGPNTYPGMGAILFDGSQYSSLVKVKEGVGSIKILTSKEQRWGDYMGAQADWNNVYGGTVWIEGIFGRSDATYGNWMAKLNSPLLGVKETHAKPMEPTVYPNPAVQYVRLRFELAKAGKTQFYIYNFSGQLVDKLLEYNCKKGKNEIQFDIASLASGTYVLKVEEANGQAVSKSFVKQ